MATILVIDDDDSIRSIFKRFLEKHGFTVDVAADGQEGLQKVEEQMPDLVVTDIMMPNKDGLEVVLALRAERSDIPVIAISGGMRSVPIDFLPIVKKFGAQRVLYKPVELTDLLEAIQAELGG